MARAPVIERPQLIPKTELFVQFLVEASHRKLGYEANKKGARTLARVEHLGRPRQSLWARGVKTSFDITGSLENYLGRPRGIHPPTRAPSVAYAISDGIARATRAESRARGMVSRGVNTFSGGTYMCRLLGLTRQPQRSSPGSSPATSAGRGHGVITPEAVGCSLPAGRSPWCWLAVGHEVLAMTSRSRPIDVAPSISIPTLLAAVAAASSLFAPWFRRIPVLGWLAAVGLFDEAKGNRPERSSRK